MSLRPTWYIKAESLGVEQLNYIKLTATLGGNLIMAPRYATGVYSAPLVLDQEQIKALRDACDEALWKEIADKDE
jgi:hypothetical protein